MYKWNKCQIIQIIEKKGFYFEWELILKFRIWTVEKFRTHEIISVWQQNFLLHSGYVNMNIFPIEKLPENIWWLLSSGFTLTESGYDAEEWSELSTVAS